MYVRCCVRLCLSAFVCAALSLGNGRESFFGADVAMVTRAHRVHFGGQSLLAVRWLHQHFLGASLSVRRGYHRGPNVPDDRREHAHWRTVRQRGALPHSVRTHDTLDETTLLSFHVRVWCCEQMRVGGVAVAEDVDDAWMNEWVGATQSLHFLSSPYSARVL